MEPEGLEPSIVQAEQIFTIDKSRVKRFVGHLTSEEMGRVDDAVKISLALNPMGSIQKLTVSRLSIHTLLSNPILRMQEQSKK